MTNLRSSGRPVADLGIKLSHIAALYLLGNTALNTNSKETNLNDYLRDMAHLCLCAHAHTS